MQSSLIFAIALLAGANACSTYNKCHCTNSDGTPNDNITQAVCNNSNKLAPKSPGWPVYYESQDSVMKCVVNTDADGVPLDNCKFREFCTNAGATGSDSFCEVPSNN
ncbi:hypothetical protein LY76DRAFT_651434 [Colletotrichum caudatum]|nr:hypothetical protein LY76DRAFT_651434 [Colletotrichum caudatum]